MKEMVILTGGEHTQNFVTVYNNKGFVEDLPRMKHGRLGHGCGHYVNTENKVVDKLTQFFGDSSPINNHFLGMIQ